MIGSMHVLDVLRERGYEPQDDPDASESWFDLAISSAARVCYCAYGRRSGHAPALGCYRCPDEAAHDAVAVTVRAILTLEDGCEIHFFEGRAVCWSARFSGAPGPVFLATLDAAEREAHDYAAEG